METKLGKKSDKPIFEQNYIINSLRNIQEMCIQMGNGMQLSFFLLIVSKKELAGERQTPFSL